MMYHWKNDKRLLAAVFVFVFGLCLIWSCVTGHVWEDFWITFRSSKNLVTGHGLVFNHGDRLHTFTSPLGVLLPALSSFLTGAENDLAAIWLYRVMGSAMFATAIALMVVVARTVGMGRFGVGVFLVMAALDAKSIDFTTNGMETGFLLGFIAYTVWSMYVAKERRWLHLGLAWAGLMWTRPDSFIYVALLSLGGILFRDATESGLTRLQWVRVFLRAGLLCTVLYLPWFLWAWWYYGSPVPHTVVAKGVLTEARTLTGALQALISFPQSAWQGRTSLEGTLLASYYQIGGWPMPVIWVTRVLTILVAVQWVFPWRSVVRVASFTFLGMHFYLSYYPFFPFPWYLPGTALLAAIVMGGTVDQLGTWIAHWRQRHAIFGGIMLGLGMACGTLLVMGQGWMTWQMMRQMQVEQELSANAVRRKTGEWLHDHAQPEDTVLMEPLGHIGYFSGLRTLDLPGLSSRESVRAMKIMKLGWGYVADYLSPDWIVLRQTEKNRLLAGNWQLLGQTYNQVAEFNTLQEVETRDIYGKDYVRHDADWTIYKRVAPKRYRLDLSDPKVMANYPLPVEAFDGGASYKLHASGVMSILVPTGATHLKINYGLPSSTYTGSTVTDGVGFQLYFVDADDQVTVLLNTELDPFNRTGDRRLKTFTTELPPGPDREIIMICTPGRTNVMDWSCWSKPVFR